MTDAVVNRDWAGLELHAAPELQTAHWFNTPKSITLEQLRGRVVVIEAFQMLCPGCVSHGLPQAMRISEIFGRDDVVVLGLHTVFEHHDVQGRHEALAAFLHEYGIRFPVAFDAPSPDGPLAKTMRAYCMQGTPTLILIDREGRLREKHFGQINDLAVGAEIMALVQEPSTLSHAPGPIDRTGCNDTDCPPPESSRQNGD